MDDTYLRKLMDWAAKAPVSEIEVVDGDIRIHLVKAGSAAVPDTAATGGEADDLLIAAPLPGVFYLRASPEAPPFVAIGQTIHVGDTIGLIEAMKMFNPVTSDLDGIVAAILVESGQEVAAGQPILRLKPIGAARQ